MPQLDYEVDIELNHFVRSKEWQKIVSILDAAKSDYVAICTDHGSDFEEIRFAQGALAAIESFYEIPNKIFGEVKNGRNDK
jgi:hypothetical protein